MQDIGALVKYIDRHLHRDVMQTLNRLFGELPYLGSTSPYLRTTRGYSIIGLLCETYRRMTGEGEWVIEAVLDDGEFCYAFSSAGTDTEDATHNGEIPFKILFWAGIPEVPRYL
jgi:hypothetical protein